MVFGIKREHRSQNDLYPVSGDNHQIPVFYPGEIVLYSHCSDLVAIDQMFQLLLPSHDHLGMKQLDYLVQRNGIELFDFRKEIDLYITALTGHMCFDLSTYLLLASVDECCQMGTPFRMDRFGNDMQFINDLLR